MKPKYIVVPGYIRSINDGDKHFITGEQLIRLYKVNPKECVIVSPGKEWGKFREADQIILEPDYTGRYEVPEEPWKSTPGGRA